MAHGSSVSGSSIMDVLRASRSRSPRHSQTDRQVKQAGSQDKQTKRHTYTQTPKTGDTIYSSSWNLLRLEIHSMRKRRAVARHHESCVIRFALRLVQLVFTILSFWNAVHLYAFVCFCAFVCALHTCVWLYVLVYAFVCFCVVCARSHPFRHDGAAAAAPIAIRHTRTPRKPIPH